MSVRADLHIHTTASDGTWTPAELIAEAQKQQLGLIAVTDHDSVANVAEAMTLAAAAGITLLPAAEICSTKEDLSFHILGYGIDIHNKQLLELMQHNEALLEQRMWTAFTCWRATAGLLTKQNLPVIHMTDAAEGGVPSPI